MNSRISKAELDEMTKRAISHTTTRYNTLGWYDAVIVQPDGTHYRAYTESLDPTAPAYIEQITSERADQLL